MNTLTWYFRLDGDDVDIQAVQRLFSANWLSLRDGRLHLVMKLPFTSSQAQAAQEAANELLSKINGIAKMIYLDHESLRIGATSCVEKPGSPPTQVVFVNAVLRGRSRVHAPIVVATSGVGQTPTENNRLLGDGVLEVADEHFKRALYLFGSLRDWRGLYMVLEAAEDGNGGEKGLIGKGWVAEGEIKNFKNTANSFKAIRLQARHGTVRTGASHPKQTLDQARQMIRTILERWGRELVSG